MEYCLINVNFTSAKVKIVKNSKVKTINFSPWYDLGQIFSCEKVVPTGNKDEVINETITEWSKLIIDIISIQKGVSKVEIIYYDASVKVKEFKNETIKFCYENMTVEQFRDQFGNFNLAVDNK